MKRSLLSLFLPLSLLFVVSCSASGEDSSAINKFLINPHELSPKSIQIDFDGDGIPDKVLVTGLKGSAIELSKIDTLVRPWQFNQSQVNTSDLSAGSKKNFFIVLSKTNAGYVVSDANPISILDTEAAQELFTVKKSELNEMGLSTIAGKTKGDLLGIPTEAGIDTYLYWNGKTFISFEPLEVP